MGMETIEELFEPWRKTDENVEDDDEATTSSRRG